MLTRFFSAVIMLSLVLAIVKLGGADITWWVVTMPLWIVPLAIVTVGGILVFILLMFALLLGV